MRIRIAKVIIFVVILLNFAALYFIWKLLSTRIRVRSQNSFSPAAPTGISPVNEETRKKSENEFKINDVTIIIRSFEEFDNDIPETVKSILSIYHNVKVVIVCDKPVYPPLSINVSSPLYQNVKVVILNPSLVSQYEERLPLVHVKGKYVLFVPDSVRFSTKQVFKIILEAFQKQSQSILAIPIKSSKPVKCLKLSIETREWFIKFSNAESADECDFVKGRHALFMKTEILHKLSDPFMLPFPDSFYIQAASKEINVQLMTDIFFSSGKSLFTTHHGQWKLQQLERERQKKMFHSLQLKKVIRESGVTEWFGCRRDTPRCFGTVVDETPQYLWEGKWTPPCCLAGLRRVARHVFHQLERSGVRYWLEGGSLLGAMRRGDILQWDYDVDIGIYKEDIPRCSWLQKASNKPLTDEQGFVWEKAVEGQFYRVQFSAVNRLHVDIFPFYSRNGTMTKNTWFKTHPQDREFPEHFLKPLSTIDFVGRSVSAPNNIHDFLELKFGEGAIENPEYPNPRKLSMKNSLKTNQQANSDRKKPRKWTAGLTF